MPLYADLSIKDVDRICDIIISCKKWCMDSFLSREEISKIGLKSYGNNVFISRHASIYSPEK